MRFDQNNPCPNCGGHNYLYGDQRCWGIAWDTHFICTKKELSLNCLEKDTGYLHFFDSCQCGKSHDGKALTLHRISNLSNLVSSRANINFAESLWDTSKPIKGTSAESYLINRGINITSDHLRYHPYMLHTPKGIFTEALISRVSDGKNKFMAIQRTYLNGGYKADVQPVKMTLGSTAGGTVKLSKPSIADGVLGIAEGIETALTITQELNIPTWACLGVNTLYKIEIPPPGIINEIQVFVDGDETGKQALKKAGEIWINRGYKVFDCQAPKGKDYNDLLMEDINDQQS